MNVKNLSCLRKAIPFWNTTGQDNLDLCKEITISSLDKKIISKTYFNKV